MLKYNKQTLLNYINGLDTPGFELEELENDKKFMMEAIAYTKDKNMYDLCSDELKKDYEFVRFMITTFSSDRNFIEQLAEDYIEDLDEEDIVYKELSVLMTSLLSKRELNTFNGRALAFYIKECIGLSALEESGELDDVLPNFGKGFFVIQTKYETSDIIQRFFAERFLSDIFFNGRINFEELIHSKAKNIKDIDEKGETIFLLNIINEVDPNLYDYTAVHIELLRPISKELDKVKNRWASYVYDRDFRRVTIFYQEAYKIMEDLQIVACDEMCEYVKVKLGLQEEFKPYEMDELDDMEYDLKKYEGPTLPLNEMMALKKLLKLARELFGNEVINTEVNQEEFEKHEGKVIQVDFGKK